MLILEARRYDIEKVMIQLFTFCGVLLFVHVWSSGVELLSVILIGLLIKELNPLSYITLMNFAKFGSSQSKMLYLKSSNNKL